MENAHDTRSIYGTLFYEFNTDENLARSYFYIYFFIRRILYSLILVNVADIPIVQITLCLILSLAVNLT